MNTFNFSKADANKIINTVDSLIMFLTNDIAESTKRRDINERENKSMNAALYRMRGSMSRFKKFATENYSLRPLFVKVSEGRCDIYADEDRVKVATLVNPDANAILTEVKAISPSWSKYIDCMCVLNAGNSDVFVLNDNYNFVPKKKVTVARVFNSLGIDKNLLSVF